MPDDAGSFYLSVYSLFGEKNTGFSRALFPSSLSIFADLVKFPAVQGDLGLWFLLVFIYFHSFHIFLMIYFWDEVNLQVSGLPYMTGKQSLLHVSLGCFSDPFPWSLAASC